MVQSREEKAMVFEALMKKLQPEGGYKPFSNEAYDKAIKATAVMKIVPSILYDVNLSLVSTLQKRDLR